MGIFDDVRVEVLPTSFVEFRVVQALLDYEMTTAKDPGRLAERRNGLEQKATVREAPNNHQGAENIINRALRTAHLLTASMRQAENAVLEAIHSFDPARETEEMLFRHALKAAIQGPDEASASNQPESAGSVPARELQAVLNLSPNLRRCFVLRILAGLSRQACARLLGLSAHRVDQYTHAASLCLSGFDTLEDGMEERALG